MKFSSKFLLTALLAAAAVFAPGAEIDRRSVLADARAATVQKYPDAETIVLNDVERVRYNPDGTDESDNESYVKIMTEKGRRNNRTLTLHYNRFYGSAKILRLEIIRPDGSIVPVDIAKNSGEAAESGQMGANIYDPDQRVLTCSIPGLAVGDILYTRIARKTVKPRIPDVWTAFNVFRSNDPIVRCKLEIDAPAARPLAVKALKGAPENSVRFSEKREKDRILYTFTAENMPRIFPEPSMPPWYFHTRRLLASTAPDWQTISKWYAKLCRPRLGATNSAMRRKVRELTAKAPTDMDKIRAVSAFVAKDIRYMGLTLEDKAPGYEPHDVNITFDKRYGVCRDKAALLVAMLELAGFKAYPVLFYAGERKDPEVPNTYFNHAIAAVELKKGEYIYIDPTNENSRDLLPASLAAMSALVARPEGDMLRTTPEIPAAQNTLDIVTRAVIDRDGTLAGSTRMVFNGVNDQAYRGAFARWSPSYRKEFFTAMLRGALPGAELTNLTVTPGDVRNLEEKLTVTLNYKAPAALDPENAVQLFTPPILGGRFGVANFVLRGAALDKREFPLVIASTAAADEKIELELAPNFRIGKAPEFRKIDTPELGLELRSRLLPDGKLEFSRRFEVRTTRVEVPRYAAFKKNLGEVERESDRRFVIERAFTPAAAAKLFPDANLLIERAALTCELGPDGHSWTARTHLVKRILTYAGLKDNAELKIAYNPVWEEIALEYAAVADPDGGIRKIGEKEQTVMDASWVASAPRYPAGKILVVNFPNVKVGSTIEYKIVRKVKDRLFFSLLRSFRSGEPERVNELTVIRPAGTPLELTKTPREAAFSEKTDGKSVTLSFTARDMPPVPDEIGRAPLWSSEPFTAMSTMKANEYASQVGAAFAKIGRDNSQASAFARKLCEGAPDDFERMERIRKYVARDIRAGGPAFGSLPLGCLSAPDVTLRERYGNSPDRAILLHSMLEAVGIESKYQLAAPPVMRFLIPEKISPVNLLDVFGSVLLEVRLNGRTFHLNDGSEYAAPGASAAENALLLSIPDGKYSVLIPEKRSGSTVVRHIKLDAQGDAAIRSTRLYLGANFDAAHRRFAEFTPEERKRELQNKANALSQRAIPVGELQADFARYPGTVSFAAKVPGYAVRDGQLLYFSSSVPGSVAGMFAVPSNRRKTPYYAGGRRSASFRERIELPSGYRVRALPRNLELDGVNVRFREADGAIDIAGAVELPDAILHPGAYAVRADAARKFAAESASGIILEPQGKNNQ